MAEVVQGTQQEFWRSPSPIEPITEPILSIPSQTLAEACTGCGSEFMIGAGFCHTCGSKRPLLVPSESGEFVAGTAQQGSVWTAALGTVQAWANSARDYARESWDKIALPTWMRYLHFHEIQRVVGLPTASLIAFIIGLGCVAGAVCVSLFYKASNLPEFQAIQMWRIEWLLAATASFVAGILLKSPSRTGRD